MQTAPATPDGPAPSRTITLELPFPPRELSPNARKGWRAKARVTKAYKASCEEELMVRRAELRVEGVRLPLTPPVTARIVFVLSTNRRRDYDNLQASFKAGQDALVSMGFLIDDDVRRFKPSYDVAIGRPAVRVELQGAE